MNESPPADPSRGDVGRALFQPQLRFDEAGRLVCHDGTLIPRVVWRSDLDRRFTLATRMPSRARGLAEAFERWFPAEHTPPTERAALLKWAAEVAPYLGVRALDPSADPASRQPDLAAFVAREPAAIAGFVAEIADRTRAWEGARFAPSLSMGPHAAPNPRAPSSYGARAPSEGSIARGKRRIALLHGERGGGSLRLAEAVAELLRETEDLEPILVSAHSDALGSPDPFERALGVRETEIWNRCFADGGDASVMKRSQEVRSALRDYFVPASVEDLARFVAEHHVEHVVSALSGYASLAQIATRAVPLTILHPDFGLDPALTGDMVLPGADARQALRRPLAPCRMFDPERVTIGLSSAQSEAALDALRADPGVAYDRLFRVLGYPTQRAFAPPGPGDLDRLRARLEVFADERVVLLMMGNDGMGDRLIELALQLRTAPLEGAPRLLVVAVCGRSERSRRAIEGALAAAGSASIAGEAYVRFRVTGLLGAADVAGYMHLAAERGDRRRGVVITKPGGATTAECAETGAHMLLVRGFPWEEGNRSFALRHGLGEEPADGALIPALVRCLHEAPAPRHAPVDFRRRLLDHLRSPRT